MTGQGAVGFPWLAPWAKVLRRPGFDDTTTEKADSSGLATTSALGMTAAKQILGPGKTLAPGMTVGKAGMRGPPACHADPARREKHPRIRPEKCRDSSLRPSHRGQGSAQNDRELVWASDGEVHGFFFAPPGLPRMVGLSEVPWLTPWAKIFRPVPGLLLARG